MRMCHTADSSDRKTVSDNSVDFLAMTASLLSCVFEHVMTIEIVVAVQRSLFVKFFLCLPLQAHFWRWRKGAANR